MLEDALVEAALLQPYNGALDMASAVCLFPRRRPWQGVAPSAPARLNTTRVEDYQVSGKVALMATQNEGHRWVAWVYLAALNRRHGDDRWRFHSRACAFA